VTGERSALVLQHDDDACPGLLGEWLRARGLEVQCLSVPELADLPDPRRHDLVVTLGSDASAVDDDLPWLAGELRLIREAHRAEVPTIGICFGGQLLSRALGGAVRAGAAAEIGWTRVESAMPELVPPGPWFEWHFDTLEPPPGAEVIATSSCGVEAFVVGRSLGLQFHPEVDREIVAKWVAGSPSDLERAGVDQDRLHRGIGDTPLRDRAWGLFDAIAEHLGVLEDGRLP
jgi:GMP synthase-like glutamine amidotransferase